MIIAGRKLRLRHYRGDKELPWIANDGNYDFDYQQDRPVTNEVKVLPGDHLATGNKSSCLNYHDVSCHACNLTTFMFRMLLRHYVAQASICSIWRGINSPWNVPSFRPPLSPTTRFRHLWQFLYLHWCHTQPSWNRCHRFHVRRHAIVTLKVIRMPYNVRWTITVQALSTLSSPAQRKWKASHFWKLWTPKLIGRPVL